MRVITFLPSYRPQATGFPHTSEEDERKSREEEQYREAENLDGDEILEEDDASSVISSLESSWVKVRDSDLDSENEDDSRPQPVRRALTRIQNSGNEFTFDDDTVFIIPEDWAYLNWEIFWDYEIPEFDGRRVQEMYRFEIDSPAAGPVFRTLRGLNHAFRNGRFRHALPGHTRRMAVAAYESIADSLVTKVSEASGHVYNLLPETTVLAAIGAANEVMNAIPRIDEVRTAIPIMVNEARVALPALIIEALVQGRRVGQRVGEIMEDVTPWLETSAQYVGGRFFRP